MKILKIISIFLLIFTTFQTTVFAKSGKGEIKLSKEIMEFLMMYMYGAGSKKFSAQAKRKNDPLLMAVSTDGKSAFYTYCPAEYRAYGCADGNLAYEMKLNCEKYSNGVPCFTFAKKRKIVWKNGSKKVVIKRSDLKDPRKVAQKIIDGGFYDGDIDNLPGIDYETGQISEDNLNKSKNDDDKSLVTKKSESENLVQELQALKKLLDDGVISEEEFTKAKSLILEAN